MVKKEIKSWLETNRQIRIKNIDYWKHPVYDLYAADMDGNVINIEKKVPMRGNKLPNGYLRIMVRRKNHKSRKNYLVHRFVYECIFGIIPAGMVIDHLNSDKEDNSLINLQLVTTKENCLRSAKNRDYSFVKDNHKNRKSVKAINIETKQVFHFNSLYAAQQYLEINAGLISMCCQGINRCKTGISKKDGQRYRFKFTTKLKITKC